MPAETVKVIVRVRPMNSKEKEENAQTCLVTDENLNQIVLNKPNENDAKAFTYDYVFSHLSAQQSIYEKTAFPLVENVVEGYNGTIFAYGQTGCGKTFTMIGDPKSEKNKGIIVRTFDHIINIINVGSEKKFLVRCSYIEIYNEEVHDLLGRDVKARMDLKESPDKGVFIKDLTINVVKSVAEMEKYMNVGTDNRATGATLMNKDSSRSHCLFTIYVECQTSDDKGQDRVTAGKLNLVDLAGSERQSKTQATGDRLKEATKINLSLSALGNVISALVDGKTAHIPYRDSKLTRLLQDSLGGNTKTLMIAAVSPADNSYEETLSTLRYASRAKLIKNQPKVNQDPKDALLLEYADEIKKLKDLLQKQLEEAAVGGASSIVRRPSHISDAQVALQGQSHIGMSQTKILEMESLRNQNDQLAKERQQFEQDLREKEIQAQREREEREKLEELIKSKEQQLMQGGKANEDEKKKFKSLQGQISKQKKEHEQLVNEKLRQEEEMNKINKDYQSLQEEVNELRDKIVYFKKKFDEASKELKDVLREGVNNRSDLLETIRMQEKELKLNQQITLMLLTQDQIDTIKGASEWNDNLGEYRIPPFQIKNKQLKFPSLPRQQAMELLQQEKEAQELFFGSSNHEEDHQNQFRIKQNNNNSNSVNSKAKKGTGQSKYSDGGSMSVNKVLSQTNMDQGLMQSRQSIFQNQQNSPMKEVYDKKFTKVQLDPITEDISVVDARQINSSMDFQASQKPGKKLLQPVEKPPIPILSQPNIQTPNQQDYKRPGRQYKLDKIN